jgi:hypothetical protein
MNIKSAVRAFRPAFLFGTLLFLGPALFGYELFIYRPEPDRALLSSRKTIIIRGELFGHLQAPSTFPSYNDLSGLVDRWSYGFRNVIYFTPRTRFLAQLVTHDDGHNRTQYDWHFSLRQSVYDNLVLVIGHDSNHDSDHTSYRLGKPFYTNRNYIGLGLPVEFESFYIEPFLWFFHHTNQRTHLDLSGDKLKQEIGVRMAAWLQDRATINIQLVSQAGQAFYLGQAFLLDVIIRVRLTDWLELSCGGSLWQDREESPLGLKQKFHKYLWGIAIPF